MKGNWVQDWRKSVIILSGGFDPIHKGHLRMFREASWMGHQVIIGLNSDEWLTRKKGKPFMEFDERKEIIEGFKYVNQVISFNDDDGTAINAIERVNSMYSSDYNFYFANGGDRTTDNVPEMDIYNQDKLDLPLFHLQSLAMASHLDLLLVVP